MTMDIETIIFCLENGVDTTQKGDHNLVQPRKKMWAALIIVTVHGKKVLWIS